MSLNRNTQKKSNSNYKYYKTIDYLILFNFFMIHKTGDLRYLLKLEDYETLPDDVDLEPLQKAWESILIQYQEEEEGNNGVINYVKGKSLLSLELDYLIYWNIYNLITTIPDSKEILQLKKDAGIENKDVKWLKKKVNSLGNQIRIKQKDFEIENKDNGKFDFYRIIDEIEQIKGYPIDIHKITVSKYIAIKKNLKAKNGRQNNSKGRNR